MLSAYCSVLLAQTNLMSVAGSRGATIHFIVMNKYWSGFTPLAIMCAIDGTVAGFFMVFFDVIAYYPYAQLLKSFHSFDVPECPVAHAFRVN